MTAPLLEMRNISKTYSNNSVKAVVNADLIIEEGEIHIIIGENGAGKSTLMHILAGEVYPDRGSINFKGNRIIPKSPAIALKTGIGMLHQHIQLIPELTVLENIVLGSEPSLRMGIFNKQKALEKISMLSDEYEITIETEKLVSSLNIEEKQKTALLSILFHDIKLLILDEPTTFFSESKTDTVYKLIRKLKNIGKSVIVITHKLGEAVEIGDYITIMREGKTIHTLKASETNPGELSTYIFKGDIINQYKKLKIMTGTPLLTIKNLCYSNNGSKIKNISLEVKKGEIAVITGIKENGLETLEYILSGKYKSYAGDIYLKNRKLNNNLRELNAGYIPSDRIGTGSSIKSSIAENMILLNYKLFSIFGFFNSPAIKNYSSALIKKYKIEGKPGQIMSTLSGGNIQRVMISREIEKQPELFIIAEPSKGLDIKSKSLIYTKLADLRNGGSGILILSSDIEESLMIADTLILLYEGRVVYNGKNNNITRTTIGNLILGVKNG